MRITTSIVILSCALTILGKPIGEDQAILETEPAVDQFAEMLIEPTIESDHTQITTTVEDLETYSRMVQTSSEIIGKQLFDLLRGD